MGRARRWGVSALAVWPLAPFYVLWTIWRTGHPPGRTFWIVVASALVLQALVRWLLGMRARRAAD